MTVVLFHITFEENLHKLIQQDLGLTPGGMANGFATSIGEEEIIEFSKDKIFVVTQWDQMIPYIDHLIAKDEIQYGENPRIPVILRISIPLEAFKEFEFHKDHTEIPLSSEPQFESWYLVDLIPMEYIEIATYDVIKGSESTWSFKPLVDYDVEEDFFNLLTLEQPVPGATVDYDDSFDMSEDVKNIISFG